MAKRMSNKDRIQRQALEVAAKDKETAEKKKTVKTTASGSKKKEKEADRTKSLKIVWKIFNDRFKEVGTFPYGEKAAAEAKAAALTNKSGKKHFVNPIKVPKDD